MCLDTTKQGYLLLKVFSENAGEGLTVPKIAEKMEKLSRDTFAGANYALSPRPLVSVIEIRHRDGEIGFGDDGGWRITDVGSENLSFLEAAFIQPYLAKRKLPMPTAQ